MKKNVIFCMAVTAITLLLTFNAKAGFNRVICTETEHCFKVPPADTPYLALVRISFSGAADTPYLQFSVLPGFVYSQIEAVLSAASGYFHIEIAFYNRQGTIIKEEDFYLELR